MNTGTKKINDSPVTEEEKKSDTCLKENQKTVKNKPNDTRKQDDWSAINVEHVTGPNNMNVPQEEKNASNAVNWDITQNVADQPGKKNHTADEEAYSAEEDQIDSIQFNKRYTEWKQKARTDHQSSPKHYWLTADQ